MYLINRVWNYFTNSEEIDDGETSDQVLSFQESIELLKNSSDSDNDNEKVEEKTSDDCCFERIGTVTFIDEHYGIIDHKLYFEHIQMSNISIGMQLTYLAYTKNGEIKISKILNKKNLDWEDEIDKTAKPYSTRNQIGKVTGRNGRIVIVEPYEDLELNLNKIESEFIPIVGDWVELHSLVEVDENIANLSGKILEVFKICPLRVKIIDGLIKSYDEDKQTGVIDNNVFFHKDSCAPGYVPLIRDKVNAEVIESDQGVLNWRALKIVPIENSAPKNKFPSDTKHDLDLFSNKNGIRLPEKLTVNLTKIGEKFLITVEVYNEGPIGRTIISAKFEQNSSQSQLSLQSPTMENSILIRPNQTIMFTIKCQAQLLGMTKELFILSFEGFAIGRWIKINVSPIYDRHKYIKNYHQRNEKNLTKSARLSFQNANKELIIGQRPVKPPSFISNKLPMYDIPERFANLVFDHMEKNTFLTNIEIEKVAPGLTADLNIKNYEEHFHTLLYLEELALQVNMRRYDMSRASFVRNGEYLMLEVADLMERRPSIIIGDKIIASDPLDSQCKPLEGFVHKTGKNHLYIKFNPNFHNMYKGEDYAVEFHSSRTNFRRYHQATDLARRNLGRKFLFPSCVTAKEPQLSFYAEDDEAEPAVVDSPEVRSKYVQMARMALLKQKRLSGESSKSSSSEETVVTKPKPSKLKLEWFDKKLNHFQKAAVKNILLGEARPLPYFIFGPPGTGKTVTLIETILQILRLMPHSRLLVVAPSNSAADLLALRLLDSGVLLPGDLVRMVAFRCVADGSIPERLIPYCVTGDLAREGSREVRACTRNGVSIGVQASVLGRHRITIGTCMVVGVLYTMGFARGHFTHIIVDEAGQATEPELMIPMSLLDLTSAQTVLAGDPLQLGPCVFSLLSKEYGLGNSFFERLITRFPYVRDPVGFPDTGGYDPRLVTRLIYNYRSLPEILKLTNTLFYNSELKPVISATDGDEVELLKKISSMLPTRKNDLPPSVIFHGVRGENFQTTDCPSWFNPVEAGQVFYYINDLYRLGVSETEIGVITPYIKQGQQVRSLLAERSMPLPKIGSVEEFQGQEFKVVILSTVRSNDSGAKNDAKYGLGFISSPRRLNVAISRAQALLIIIGNPHLLYTDNYWRSVLLYARKIGGYVGCHLPEIVA